MNKKVSIDRKAVATAAISEIKLALNQKHQLNGNEKSPSLEHLVLLLLDIGEADAMELASLAESPIVNFNRTHENFYNILEKIIRVQRLSNLFTRIYDRQHHRSICPTAFNPETGTNDPKQMEQWRADFRAMAPERQMLAASIIWLYQAGPDSTWLRRVLCTWRADEALNYMRDAGCLTLWLTLMANYRAW